MRHRRPTQLANRTFRNTRLRGESLEAREMLAGDVTASVVRGTLYLTGDNRDNFVEVFGTGTPNQFVVEGFTDNLNVNTTVNHHTGQLTFNGVTNISVTLKGGADFFGFEQGTVGGNLSIDMGDGNDEVNVGIPKIVTGTLSSPTAKAAVVPIAKPATPTTTTLSAATICGTLCVNLGSGNNWLIEGSTHVKQSETVTSCDQDDKIEFIDTGGVQGGNTIGSGVVVDCNLTVNLGCGTNYLEAYDLRVNGSLKVNGSGSNNVELAVLNVCKDAIFNLCGKGEQDFAIEPEEELGSILGAQQSRVGGNLVVNTGSGNDHVTESSLAVGCSNTISTGCGNDTVNLGEGNDEPDDIDYELTVGKDLCVNLGGGCDTLTTNDVRVMGNVTINQGTGTTTIHLVNIVGNALTVKTDGGKDDVSFEEVDFNKANVNLGSGNDRLTVSNTTITTSTFDGGTGVNTYVDGGANSLTNLTKKHFS